MFIKVYDKSPYESYLVDVVDRIKLDDIDEAKKFTFYNGYIGEKQFYEEIKSCGGIKAWNIRLNLSGEVQYDFFIIHEGYLIHIDVKNFSGRYTYRDNNFISESNYVIKDPISQLNSTHFKLKVFCEKHNLNYIVKSYVLFINETFTVSGFNGHSSILFRNDLQRIKASLVTEPNQADIKAMELIVSYHLNKSKNEQRIHYYPFEQLKPGLKCPSCFSFLKKFESFERKIECSCGHKVSKKEAVHLGFETVRRLKNDAVKSSEIAAYTGVSESTIKQIMRNEYEYTGSTCGRKYINRKQREIFLREARQVYYYRKMEENV